MTTSRLRPAALTLTLSLAALPAAVAHAATQTLSHAGIATYTVRADAGIRATWIERRHPSAPVPVLREATAAPGASTFGAAHTLAVLSSDAGPVDMTTDAQGGHVLVWDASAGSWPHKVSRGVWFSIVRPDGTRTPKRQLNAPGSRAKFSAVRGNAAGDALACWWQRSPRAQPWKARCAIRRAGSGHFGPATTLSFHQVTPPQLYPIVNGEGRLLVVSELSRSQILAVQGTLRDGWGARTVISPDRRAHFKYDYNFDPIQSIFNVAMAPDGSATVAFVENEPATGVMFQNAAHVVRLNAGGGVAQRQALGVLPEGDAEWTAPVLTTLGDGSTLLAFAGDGHMMVTRAPADPATPFPTPLPIGTSDVDDIYPYIAPGPGNSAALTWTLPPPAALSPSVVQFARYDGTSWSASTSVSAPKRTASYPVVALTTDGAAGLAWADDGLLALIIR